MKKSAKTKSKSAVKTTKTAKTKLKYVESHWGVFILQGLIALSAGAYIMLSNSDSIQYLVSVVGCVLIGLAIIELLNVLIRRRRQHGWGIPLAVAIFQIGVGTAMLFASDQTHVVHIALLAGYTLVHSVASIFIGFVSCRNLTDRFFWVACGMVGSVIAFVIFADPGFSETVFIKIFGTFLMVLGLTNVFFALHSREKLGKK